MSPTSLEQASDIDLARYRRYVFTQRRVSEWVQQTRPDAAKPLYSRLKDRKQPNTNRNSGKSSLARRTRTPTQKPKGRHSGTHYSNTSRKSHPQQTAASISPVVALVSSSLVVWAFDLVPSIVGLFGFAFLLKLATTPAGEKVRAPVHFKQKKDNEIDHRKESQNEKGAILVHW